MQIPDLNQMQNNFGNQMNNMNKEFLEMNLINNMKDFELNNSIKSDENFMSIIFFISNNKINTIIVKYENIVKELLNLYRIKIGENVDFLFKNIFLFNGKILNPNEETKVIYYGFIHITLIRVKEI